MSMLSNLIGQTVSSNMGEHKWSSQTFYWWATGNKTTLLCFRRSAWRAAIWPVSLNFAMRPSWFHTTLLFFYCYIDRLRVQWQREDCVSLTWGLGQYQLLVSAAPFRLEVTCDGEEIVTVNPGNRLCFETLQKPVGYDTSNIVVLDLGFDFCPSYC